MTEPRGLDEAAQPSSIPPTLPTPVTSAPATPVASTPPPTPAASTPAPTAAPLASVIAKPKSSSSRGTSLLLGLAAAIAIGGLAFAAGRLTAPAATVTAGRGTGQFPGNGTGQLPGNGQGFPGRSDVFGGTTLKGTVEAITADSVTLKLASGTSITIPLDASTKYHTSTPSSADAVRVGSEVSVSPGARTANPDATRDPNSAPNPNASGAPGLGGLSFGAATDVTVVAP
jgi:hypothetical protein